jgi:hypothetical protein
MDNWVDNYVDFFDAQQSYPRFARTRPGAQLEQP